MALLFNNLIISKSGIIDNKSISLKKGINVIYGESDSGKTFIAKSILNVLSLFSNNEKPKYDEINKNLYINLEFDYDDEKFKIVSKGIGNCDLYHINSQNEVQILSLTNSDNIQDNENFNYIKILFETTNDKFLNFTSFVFSPFEETIKTVDFASISELFSNDSSDYYSIYKLLNNTFLSDDISFSKKNINSLISQKEKMIREAEKNIEISELKKQKSGKLNSELISLNNDKKILELKLNSLDNKIEKLSYFSEIRNKINNLNDKTEQIFSSIEMEKNKQSSIKELSSDLQKVYPQFSKLNKIQKENFDKIQETYKEIKDNDNLIEKQIENNHKVTSFFKKTVFLLSVITVCLMLFLHFQEIYSISKNMNIIINSVILSSYLIIIGINVFNFNKFIKFNPLIKLNTFKETKTNAFYQLLSDNELKVNDLTTDEIYEFLLQYFEEYGFYTEREDEIIQIKESLKDSSELQSQKKELKNLENKLKKYRNELKSIIQEIEIYENFSIEDFPIEDAKNYILNQKNEFSEELENIVNLIEQIKSELNTQSNDETEGAEFHSKKEIHFGKLELLKEYKNAALFIRDTMEETIKNREEKILDTITDQTLDFFNKITNNSYSDKITKSQINNIINSGTISDIDNKSLIKMIDISIKLAVTESLGKINKNFPLIIDEPSVYLDKNRLENFKNIIKDFSKKRQIIIFTHDNNAFKKFGNFIKI